MGIYALYMVDDEALRAIVIRKMNEDFHFETTSFQNPVIIDE
jgi:hypothetical protein